MESIIKEKVQYMQKTLINVKNIMLNEKERPPDYIFLNYFINMAFLKKINFETEIGSLVPWWGGGSRSTD